MTKDIENLKSQWLADPGWDLEDTEGFEDDKDQLRLFRLKMENRWKQARENQIEDYANKFRCSPELAKYIIRLEMRMYKIENNLPGNILQSS